MSDFLDFLNTASLDELTLIPGISRFLAANVIAARPFDFVEDCLHVKGMGKNLLGRAQSYFETAMNNSSNRAVVPVLEDSVPVQASIEEKLVDNNNQALLELKHEIMITRALDMLGRARLYLAQSNFGSAKQDVQSARDLLVELQTETEDPLLDMAIERLDLTLGNLPAFPVVAAGDLEIAWQLLITGEAPPPVTPQILSTFTPIPQTTGTPTP